MGADFGAGSLVGFLIKKQIQPLKLFTAVALACGPLVGPVLVVSRHDCFPAASPVPPRSRAQSGNMPSSIRRPRRDRDMTVPIGGSMMAAIALYGRRSTPARYTASRNSAG